MCWNENISLNTFLFSGFILALIIYNNTFTKYKIKELNNKWLYLFIISILFVQLIEFFIWRNINNKFYNNVFSIIAMSLITVQPMISIMILTNIKLRNFMLFSYLLLAIPFSIYNFSTNHIISEISKNGHLKWLFYESSTTSWFIWFIWIFFFLFSIVYEKKWFAIVFGLITLLITALNYNNDNSFGSMWCWSINLIMIYYAFYLVIYLPFLEKMKFC